MKKRYSMPILAWVAIGLAVVSALPFAQSWFQIDRTRDLIIRQAQTSHLIVASSAATGIEDYFRLFHDLLIDAGEQPEIYLDPDSDAAAGELARLAARPDLARVGLFQRLDEGFREAQTAGAGPPLMPQLSPLEAPPPAMVLAAGGPYLRLQRDAARPDYVLAALVDMREVASRNAPPEILGEAELLVLDESGRLVIGKPAALATVPPTLIAEFADAPLRSRSDRFETARGNTIAALSRVGDFGWTVISLQPVTKAEAVAAEQRRAAWQSFAAVAVIIVMLLLSAQFFVVAPIRRLIAGQRRLMGVPVDAGGNEIAQLEESFESLERSLNERDSLSEIFLGRYQVVRRIGAGAMGTVYLGWDPKLKRNVALKTIRFSEQLVPEGRRELTEALLQEGITSARLTHPNIVTVFDVMGDKEFAFIAMEYVDGEGLDRKLTRAGRLSPRFVAEVAECVLKALKAAHSAGIVHRDIKPANVMVSSDGTVKVADFGIAGLLQRQHEASRIVMGTPGYLAPECYRTGEFGPRTDLFALGVLIVECLTGQTVFPGRNTAQVITRTASKDVRLPAALAARLPPEMTALIDALLAKEPAERIASADEALARWAQFRDRLGELSDRAEDAAMEDVDAGEKQDATVRMAASARTRRLD